MAGMSSDGLPLRALRPRRHERGRREDPRRRRRGGRHRRRSSRHSMTSLEQEAAEILSDRRPGHLDYPVAPARSHRPARARERDAPERRPGRARRRRTAEGFVRALVESGIKAPLYITQNDGTVSLADASRRSSRSIASRRARPIRCAARRSCPASRTRWWSMSAARRRTSAACATASRARRTTMSRSAACAPPFRMPDLLSIGLGGGTLVDPSNPARIGP